MNEAKSETYSLKKSPNKIRLPSWNAELALQMETVEGSEVAFLHMYMQRFVVLYQVL
jgi:hypothetical protein